MTAIRQARSDVGRVFRVLGGSDSICFVGLSVWGDVEDLSLDPEDVIDAESALSRDSGVFRERAFLGRPDADSRAVAAPCRPRHAGQSDHRQHSGSGYVRFTVSILDAPRRTSCTGDRTPVQEVFAARSVSLWLNQ